MKRNAEYILLLNNDTIIGKSFFEHIIKTADHYKGKAVVTSKILYAYEPQKIWYAGGEFNNVIGRTVHSGMNRIDNQVEEGNREVSFISGCCMLTPSDIVRTVGNLNEDFFLYCEDLEYCCRIRNAGYKLIYDPAAILYHKVSASTSKVSNMVTYYTVRNKYYIIKEYIPQKYYFLARFYNWLQIRRRI